MKDGGKLEMAILRSPCPLNSKVHPVVTTTALIATHCPRQLPPPFLSLSISSKLYNHQQTPQPTTKESAPQKIRIDKSFLDVSEATSDTELWAAACLRVRTFYDFQDQDFGIQGKRIGNQDDLLAVYEPHSDRDHKRYLAEHEYKALKERIAGTRLGFKKVSCINATLPWSQVATISDDLCKSCKFSKGQEERVVVGTLDLNQCIRLPDEITGMKPKGIGADFARAYLTNVCVAKELQRNGLGYDVIAKAKIVARNWGISDLYVHVAVDNEPAKNLYLKSGFVRENEEPAWQARFLDRPRRLLLWIGLPITYEL